MATRPFSESDSLAAIIAALGLKAEPGNVVVFTARGAYVPPPNLREAYVVCICGGGSGAQGRAWNGAGFNASGGGGGGGGGWSDMTIDAALMGDAEAVVVGAGGAAGLNNGLPGGSSSFGAFITAAGGSGAPQPSSGVGSAGAGGSGSIYGGAGASTGSSANAATPARPFGLAPGGGGGGGGVDTTGAIFLPSSGAFATGATGESLPLSSIVGGRGGNGSTASSTGLNPNGEDGQFPGGGGGGSGANGAAIRTLAGAGANGVVIIVETF